MRTKNLGIGITLIGSVVLIVAVLSNHPTALSDSQSQSVGKNNCDPSYPDFCISAYSVDLDCDQIPYHNFRVLPPDRHGFDRDRDGIGCE